MGTRKMRFEMDIEGLETPTYFVYVVKLPNGAIELITNTQKIMEKINYILSAYDDDMLLKTNSNVEIINWLIV